MTYTHCCRRALMVAAGWLTISTVWAQTEPIRNWPAPLYWQPSAREAALLKPGGEAPLAAGTPAADPTPLTLVAITPCRMLDTRGDPAITGIYGPPMMAAGEIRQIPVAGVTAGHCNIPGSAQAVSINLTLATTTPVRWVTIWPVGQPMPTASTVNDYQGVMVNNGTVAPLGSGGGISSGFAIYATDATHLFIDVNGYYIAGDLGSYDTALGTGALGAISGGTNDTAFGYGSLASNSSGSSNTAIGANALTTNTAGSSDTAVGVGALYSATGSNNTGLGYFAGYGIGSGSDNTMVGYQAGRSYTGSQNTMVGSGAGYYATGGYNALFGYQAGYGQSGQTNNGNYNAIFGYRAGYRTTTGEDNTLIGQLAGSYLTTGSGNTLIGQAAGNALVAGSWNIYLWATGSADESNTIRIGDTAQTRAFITGIRGVTTGNNNAIPVYIDSAGQLGTASSSRRVKRDIRDMGDTTATLMGLRPVRFRYTAHGPDGPEQYGLVAEEVAEVAPELVAHDQDGKIETVFYDKVNAMLLNEVQKQHRLIESQASAIRQLESQASAIRQLESQASAIRQIESQASAIRQLESRLAELEGRTAR